MFIFLVVAIKQAWTLPDQLFLVTKDFDFAHKLADILDKKEFILKNASGQVYTFMPCCEISDRQKRDEKQMVSNGWGWS